MGVVGASQLSGLLRASPARAAVPFTSPLTFPQVITDPAITLTAAPADVQVLPGQATRMWTFNGSFPGPLIRRPSGQPTTLTIDHQLPDAGDLTIHHHGNHSSPDNDGQPRPDVMIAPGTQRTYSYDMLVGGGPEVGALRWYHDHSHPNTTRNTWMGLLGLFILDDDFDSALPLPRGAYELPLIISDRTFDSGNQLVSPWSASTNPGAGGVNLRVPGDDVTGLTYLVNGVPQPYVQVEARRYRLRILNGSVERPYDLTLSGGGALTQIGNESGLLRSPAQSSSYPVGPAQRLDLIADFTGLEGKNLVLQSVNNQSSTSLATAPASAQLLQFQVVAPTSTDTTSIPTTLRPLPDWVSQLNPDVVDRVWAFGLGADTSGTAWTVNGRTFDPARIDARPGRNSVETWMLINTTPMPMSHYIHIHGGDWYMLSVNGLTPIGAQDSMGETFTLDPGEMILIGGQFADYEGPYMIHCHMLNHEDHGMMTNFQVMPPGQGDLPLLPGPVSLPPAGGAPNEVLPIRLGGRQVSVPLGALAGSSRAQVKDVLAQIAARPGCPADPIRAYKAATGKAPPKASPGGNDGPALYCKL